MSNDLFVNDLIEWVDELGNSFIERILWIDEGYVIAFTIDINVTTGFPVSKRVSDIQEDINEGRALKLKKDPWARIVRDEDLSAKNRDVRDKYWNIISSIVNQEPSIYYREQRGSLVKQVIEEYNNNRSDGEGKLIERSVYTQIRRYWQRGKKKNSLLPDYTKSGGKGKTRKAGDKKRGRPRNYSHETEIGIGINISEEDKKIFRLAIAKFYHNRKENFLTTAYELMIKNYYSEDTIYDENGVKKHILIPPERRPTLRQFKYWYGVEQGDIRKKIISRKGAKKYALEYRAITGNSTMETIGPGSRYQIDATIADVYIVSSYNRNWIVGRPVIYVVIDVFSRMITGVYVGFEGPSWIGGMMALANAASDKVAYCKEYGIEIAEDEWACHHIPDAILGDRGELAGMKVETLIPNLGIRIENAPPYRADWKGLVERHFGVIHGHIKPFVPGFIDKDFRERGARDYRLDSKLDIEQFTEIIIKIILYHNNEHYLDRYERDETMIADGVSPIPKELWKWGVANRSGRLRTIPEDIVKLNLMPTGNAWITERGIKFKGMYYTCEKAKQEFWFENARSNSLTRLEKKLEVSYDIRKLDYIYLRSPDGREFEKCFLLESESKYCNKNLHDIEYLWSYEKLQIQKNKGLEQQQKVDLIAEIESVVSRAEKMTEETKDDNLSDRKKVAGIRDNRSAEKAKRRENEGFELEKDENKDVSTSNTQNIDSKKPEQPQSLELNRLNLLRQMQQKRKNEQNK
ncbi:MAG: Mu transposase C-terminal domain-containing protein [Cyanobacteria bacterium J06633_8]